jgi:hypothetical protein
MIMNELELFFADNVEESEVVEYVASPRFKDKEGNPLKWQLKAVSSEECTEIKKKCVKKVPIPGKRGQYTQDFDSTRYNTMMCAATVVYPDLNNAALQDSWGKKTGTSIMSAEQLLNVMLIPGELDLLSAKVTEVNGYTNINDDIEEAKN